MKYIDKIMLFDEKKTLAFFFLAALALRLAAVINLPTYRQVPTVDDAQYDTLAVNLLAGKGFTLDSATGKPTSWRMPLYPLFLASIYSIFGHNYLAVRIIQCIMSALLCIMIFYIGKMTFGRKTGFFAALILAFYQPYIYYLYYGGPAFLFSENLFNFLFLIFILFLVKEFFVNPSLKNSVIS